MLSWSDFFVRAFIVRGPKMRSFFRENTCVLFLEMKMFFEFVNVVSNSIHKQSVEDVQASNGQVLQKATNN